MVVVSIQGGTPVNPGGGIGQRFTKGDYVFLDPGEKNDRTRLQVIGYDWFGQVVVEKVCQQHRKRVPRDVWPERSLVLARGDE